MSQFKKILYVAMFLSPITVVNAAHHQEDSSAHKPADSQAHINTYVLGFIQGALLTDETIISNLGENKETSAFVERAFKTRLGRKAPTAAYYANFCLPEGMSSDAVAANVSKKVLGEGKGQDKSAVRQPDSGLSGQVYKALKQLYPCKD